MKLKAALPLAAPLFAAACATGSPDARPAKLVPIPAHVTSSSTGPDRLLGHSAKDLTGLFGQPDADLVEGLGRKMQFGSRICVLDAYLYPPQSGHGDARVTHVDVRQRDGSTIDRASCVAALTRREGGK